MSIQELGGVPFETDAGDLLSKIAKRIEEDPAGIEQDLLKTRGIYEKMIKEQPVATRAFSPLRAGAIYLQMRCSGPIKLVAKDHSGEKGRTLRDVAEGIHTAGFALIRAEGAIARGVRGQVLFELAREVSEMPSDDQQLYIEHNYEFKELLIQRQMDRLLEDSTGKKVIEGEYDDITTLAQGFSPYYKTMLPESAYNRAHVMGVGFADRVYKAIYPYSRTLFLETVL